MAETFGIPQVTDYLMQMGLKISHVDTERELIELAFHGNQGQWRLIVGFQQSGDVRKLLLIAPHIGTVTSTKRMECLEALLAVNYRIALGKFGVDLVDGEVRLEESIPVGTHILPFCQFQLALSALLQTIAMYHSLLPRIVYGCLSVPDALEACEQEFIQQTEHSEKSEIPDEVHIIQLTDESSPAHPIELDVNDIMAEITRILEQNKD